MATLTLITDIEAKKRYHTEDGEADEGEGQKFDLSAEGPSFVLPQRDDGSRDEIPCPRRRVLLSYDRNPIESITTRLKSIDQIYDKARRKGIALNLTAIEENIYDIAE